MSLQSFISPFAPFFCLLLALTSLQLRHKVLAAEFRPGHVSAAHQLVTSLEGDVTSSNRSEDVWKFEFNRTSFLVITVTSYNFDRSQLQLPHGHPSCGAELCYIYHRKSQPEVFPSCIMTEALKICDVNMPRYVLALNDNRDFVTKNLTYRALPGRNFSFRYKMSSCDVTESSAVGHGVRRTQVSTAIWIAILSGISFAALALGYFFFIGLRHKTISIRNKITKRDGTSLNRFVIERERAESIYTSAHDHPNPTLRINDDDVIRAVGSRCTDVTMGNSGEYLQGGKSPQIKSATSECGGGWGGDDVDV